MVTILPCLQSEISVLFDDVLLSLCGIVPNPKLYYRFDDFPRYPRSFLPSPKFRYSFDNIQFPLLLFPPTNRKFHDFFHKYIFIF